jgi:hypothetical protein
MVGRPVAGCPISARDRPTSIDLMLGPTRPFPRVGAPARICHFGGGFERAVVVAVREEGRRLEVRGEAGEAIEFVLSLATARFLPVGDAQGPRLELLDDLAGAQGA